MSRVDGVRGRVVASGQPKPASAQPGGFSVGDASADAAPLPPAAGAQAVGLIGMLALQEAESDTASNRQGRRHGLAMLQALQQLQHGLLEAAPAAEEQIATLAALAAQVPSVSDPVLTDMLRAIRLRAKIELFRRGG